ncbi:MAG: serine/threonine-protein kinase [Nannocystaceae bacterium]
MAKLPDEYMETLRRRGFVLGDWLGSGAYGQVYRALQTSLNRNVAVKFFEEGFAKAKAENKRAHREPLLLARVEHPAIPYVLTRGKVRKGSTDIPYTVMQYVAGPTLEQRMSTSTMAEAEIHRVMRDILSALNFVHDNGVVHRDVKPGNIIVSDQGTFLLDFSIGVSLEHAPGLTRATKMEERVGTYEYAAPEQIADSSSIDHRADIYSAAVVLAEMLGARPRLQVDRIEIELQRASQKIRDVIRCGAAEKPDDRYQSAEQLLAAFNAVMGPGYGGIFDDRIALCPNLKCGQRVRSSGERGPYYFGPSVVGPTFDRFCSCGTEYIRACPGCSVPLPPNIAERVSKSAKSEPDALEDHCRQCGTLIFRTPICSCKSYFSLDDIDQGEKKCQRCRRQASASRGYGDYIPQPSDDDGPF